jgi:hypothetical protein
VALAAGASFLVLVLLITWTWWAGQGSSIIDQIHHRTINMRSDSGSAITLRAWFDWVVMGINFKLHTPLMLVLTVGYVLAMLWLALRRRWDLLERHLGPILVLGWGFAYLFTGIQHTFQHRWCDAFLTSGFAMASAAALWALARRAPAALGRPGVRLGVVAALALAYGLWTLPFARAERQREYRGIDDGYSLRALGMMIRTCSDERDGVLTSDCFVRPGRPCNSHPTLWYYADRQMRVGVRTPADLDAALSAGPYPAMFLYWSGKSTGPAPKWFVLPRAHRKQLPKLTASLDARFRRRPMALYGEWFDVYALQEPVKTAQ